MAKKKRTTKKRTTKKKTTRRAASAEPKPRTKSQIFKDISEETGVARKDVAAVFESMTAMIKKDLSRSKNAPGSFTVPGLMKIQKVHKARRPARKNVPNPFRPGEFMDVAAKPAHNVVKVRALKALKDMV